MRMRLKPIALAAILALSVRANVQEQDVLLTATHDKLNETVRQALAADAETLKKWSKKIAKEEAARKGRCLDFEKRYLAGFYNSLAESKEKTGEEARQARAHAAWKVYHLASMSGATKEDLKQLLLQAKDGAPPGPAEDAPVWDFATQDRIEKSLTALERPTPDRIRISQQTSECYLISKVQPVYPPVLKSNRTQGDAVLKVVVGRDGKVMEITPVSGEPGFIKASTDAVKHWQYRPYRLSGQAVEFETIVTVKFTMMGGLGPRQWPNLDAPMIR